MEKCEAKVTCDMESCKNLAEYSFAVKGRTKRWMVCGECLKKMYSDISGVLVPDSPKNRIKRIMDQTEKGTEKENKRGK